MNVITEYCTLTALGSVDLDVYVAQAIAEGWQPLGGVAFAIRPDIAGFPQSAQYWFAQAMVKYAEPKIEVTL